MFKRERSMNVEFHRLSFVAHALPGPAFTPLMLTGANAWRQASR